jgi:hypothetical protein
VCAVGVWGCAGVGCRGLWVWGCGVCCGVWGYVGVGVWGCGVWKCAGVGNVRDQRVLCVRGGLCQGVNGKGWGQGRGRGEGGKVGGGGARKGGPAPPPAPS